MKAKGFTKIDWILIFFVKFDCGKIYFNWIFGLISLILIRFRFFYLILMLTGPILIQIHSLKDFLGINEARAKNVVSWTSGGWHALISIDRVALCVILDSRMIFLDSISDIQADILRIHGVDVNRRMLPFISCQVKVWSMRELNLRRLFPLVQVKICDVCALWVLLFLFFEVFFNKRVFTQKVLIHNLLLIVDDKWSGELYITLCGHLDDLNSRPESVLNVDPVFSCSNDRSKVSTVGGAWADILITGLDLAESWGASCTSIGWIFLVVGEKNHSSLTRNYIWFFIGELVTEIGIVDNERSHGLLNDLRRIRFGIGFGLFGFRVCITI